MSQLESIKECDFIIVLDDEDKNRISEQLDMTLIKAITVEELKNSLKINSLCDSSLKDTYRH